MNHLELTETKLLPAPEEKDEKNAPAGGGESGEGADRKPSAAATPDGKAVADEGVPAGMMPVADVERDYVSREEAEKAAREAYLRGMREQVEASWETDPALPSEIASIFNVRKSVWD